MTKREARFGAQVVLTGSSQEQELTSGICRALPVPAINAAGKLTVRQTAAVIKQCRLFISNDSGIAHVAAGVGTPLVVVFGPTDVRRIAPQGKRVCILPKPSHDVRDVTTTDVLAQAEKVLHG